MMAKNTVYHLLSQFSTALPWGMCPSCHGTSKGGSPCKVCLAKELESMGSDPRDVEMLLDLLNEQLRLQERIVSTCSRIYASTEDRCGN